MTVTTGVLLGLLALMVWLTLDLYALALYALCIGGGVAVGALAYYVLT